MPAMNPCPNERCDLPFAHEGACKHAATQMPCPNGRCILPFAHDGACKRAGYLPFAHGLAKDDADQAAPIAMILRCSACGERHIDEGEFATKPHHTHACQFCGEVWRPAIGPTVGVKFLPGFKSTGSVQPNSIPIDDECARAACSAALARKSATIAMLEQRLTAIAWPPRDQPLTSSSSISAMCRALRQVDGYLVIGMKSGSDDMRPVVALDTTRYKSVRHPSDDTELEESVVASAINAAVASAKNPPKDTP